MTVLFSMVLLQKKYTGGQLLGVSVVACGLAAKATEVVGVGGGDGETLNSSRRRSVRGRIGNKLLHERYFDGILVEIDEKSTERRRDELRDGLVWVGSAGGVYFGRHRAE